MKIRNHSRIKNHVTATILDKDGNVLDIREGHNTITSGNPSTINNGFVLMLDRMFNNGDFYDPGDFINKMKLGTGTPSNSGLGTPTGSYKTIAVVGTIDISTLTAPSITVKGTWDAGDGALSGITEVGLFADNVGTTLFAYKTFSPGLVKTAGGTLIIEWTITFS